MVFFYSTFGLVIFAVCSIIVTMILYNWYGIKWLTVSEIFAPAPLMLQAAVYLFFGFNGHTIRLFMLAGATTILVTCVWSFLPHLSPKRLVPLLAVVSAVAWYGGKPFLIDPRVETRTIARMEGCMIFGGGWLQGESRIFLDVQQDAENQHDEEEDIVLVLDVASGEVVARVAVAAVVFPFSFHPAPEGQALALVEFARDADGKGVNTLSLLDAESLNKRVLLQKHKIRLTRDGCWNHEGTLLAGMYVETADTEDGEMCGAFALNVATGELNTFEPGEQIQSVCWLPDGDLAVLHYSATKAKERKDRLYTYTVTRVAVTRSVGSVLYRGEALDWGGVLSPRGNFLLEASQEGEAVILDLVSGVRHRTGARLADCVPGRKNVHWAPDESCVLLELQEGDDTVLGIWDQSAGGIRRISLQSNASLYRSSWSADSQWFCVQLGNSMDFFAPIVLVSRDGEQIVRVGGTGGFGFSSAVPNRGGSRVLHTGSFLNLHKNGIGATVSVVEVEADRASPLRRMLDGLKRSAPPSMP